MNTQRLFFALWPTEQVRQSVVNAATPHTKNLNGTFIEPKNLHITLHFIGQVNEEDKDQLLDAARTVTGESFVLDINCFGHFPRAKVLWMGPQKPPVELVQLHEKLGDVISDCGYQRDKRPFHPHVTLMKKCDKPLMGKEKITVAWAVDEFVLVESVPDGSGVDYRIIEQYPLA